MPRVKSRSNFVLGDLKRRNHVLKNNIIVFTYPLLFKGGIGHFKGEAIICYMYVCRKYYIKIYFSLQAFQRFLKF